MSNLANSSKLDAGLTERNGKARTGIRLGSRLSSLLGLPLESLPALGLLPLSNSLATDLQPTDAALTEPFDEARKFALPTITLEPFCVCTTA